MTYLYRRFSGSLLPGLITAGGFLLLAGLLFYQLAAYPSASLSLGRRVVKILAWTTLQASLSTLLSIIIGMLLAWALSHCRNFPGRQLIIALLSSAMVLPTLVVVLGIVTVLGRSGWLNQALAAVNLPGFDPFIFGLTGILIAHCYFNASYSARTLLIRLESIPLEQYKLSRSLGLNAWQRFRMIELPAITGTLPNLATTIFLLCFTSFSVVLVLGGSPKYNTLEVSIYEAIKLDFDLGRALGLALTQLAICAALVVIAYRSRQDNRLISDNDFKHQRWPDSFGVKGLQVIIITGAALAFIAPLLAVTIDGMAADFATLLTDRNFLIATVTSLVIALLSTALVLASSIALAIAYTTLATDQRMAKTRGAALIARLINFSSTLYLAVPSLVLGLGFFLLARNIGGGYLPWAVAALLTANVLMVLPFAVATLAPAMVKAANRYDKLAYSIGLKRRDRWRLVESQLLKREMTYIASLAFCMSMGDLGVIALFGNQDFTTLPWLLYQKMGSYRTDEAAGIALIMLSITLGVFLLLPKLAGINKRHA